jgi:prevent-host-death family protein
MARGYVVFRQYILLSPVPFGEQMDRWRSRRRDARGWPSGARGVDRADWSDKVVIMKTLAATEFKARCLAVLDRVARTGEEVTITKRGKPVARLVPPTPQGGSPLRHPLAGSVEIVGDIVGPVLPSKVWAAVRDKAPPERARGRRPVRRRT